jgi:sulfate adenylyltransferase subunit 2
MDAIRELRLDAAIGGARRDEEKARAKERFFSLREASGAWNPEAQRPEIWRHFDGTNSVGGHCRVFPLSNWTELDVWAYIARRNISLPPLYFAHEREVFLRDGILLARTPYTAPDTDEVSHRRTVRFRTVGDATCTGAVVSEARDVATVVDELRASRLSERGGRGDDRRSDAAMEDRKRQGYF